LFAGTGTLFIEETSDYRIYFDEYDPLLQSLEALEETYIREDSALIVIAPENGKVFRKNVLTGAFPFSRWFRIIAIVP